MSAQRKRYLQLAEGATTPRSKLFYRLMADIAPPVNEMARRNVNQIGGDLIYQIVMQAAAGIVSELAFNLSHGKGISAERLAADFRKMLDDNEATQQVMGEVECTPKLDA